MVNNYNSLLDEASFLADSAIEGKLTVRANPEKFNGEYAKLIQEMNDIVNTLVGHLDNVPVPFMIIDNDYSINYVNNQAAGVASLSLGDMLERKCHDIYKTSACGTDSCVCHMAMVSGNNEKSEGVASIGGQDINLECSGAPLKDRQGKVIGCLEIFTDQTQIRTAIADARTKVDYLNSIPTPIMAMDTDLNVKFINPAGAAALKSTTEACTGKKCYDLFKTPHCNTENCQVAKSIKTGEVCTSDTVARLPSGDLPIRYTATVLKDADGNVVGALEYVFDLTTEVGVTEEVLNLAEAAVKGKLDVRADADKFTGNNHEIMIAVNNTLDSVISPLNVAAEYVDHISKGDIPDKITEEYYGDFNDIKNNLNGCIDAINALVEDANNLAQAGINGQLSTRADASRHHGDFRKIVEGVNGCLDAVIHPFNEATKVINAYAYGDLNARFTIDVRGDFKELGDTLNGFGNSLQSLISDLSAVLTAISENDLSHPVGIDGVGDFKALTDGIEDTRKSLNRVISMVHNNSRDVASTAEEMSASVEEVSSSSYQIADTVSEISRGAQNQASKTEEVSRAMVDMTLTVQEVATNSQKAAQNAR
ncbi:PAS domain-containing protein [Methanolobus sp. ZRKC5]|uniref:PAS domain-containing protein n=1 Tax=Methanolobus sp. ZRKC5 TaxID=3136295 RepID=UPI00313D19AE